MATLSSGKGKKKVNDRIGMSNDDFDDKMVAKDKVNALGNDYFLNNENMQGYVDKEEMEVKFKEDAILLQGTQLGGLKVGEEKSDQLARIRFQVIPQVLFGSEGPLR